MNSARYSTFLTGNLSGIWKIIKEHYSNIWNDTMFNVGKAFVYSQRPSLLLSKACPIGRPSRSSAEGLDSMDSLDPGLKYQPSVYQHYAKCTAGIPYEKIVSKS